MVTASTFIEASIPTFRRPSFVRRCLANDVGRSLVHDPFPSASLLCFGKASSTRNPSTRTARADVVEAMDCRSQKRLASRESGVVSERANMLARLTPNREESGFHTRTSSGFCVVLSRPFHRRRLWVAILAPGLLLLAFVVGCPPASRTDKIGFMHDNAGLPFKFDINLYHSLHSLQQRSLSPSVFWFDTMIASVPTVWSG